MSTVETTDGAEESNETSPVESSPADRAESDVDETASVAPRRRGAPRRLALAFGLSTVVALASVMGWLGIQVYQTRQSDDQSNLFVQVARQGAINLTTIDWQHVDTDIKRILDTATGTFHDDFSKRAKPFGEVIKKAQSKSVGTVVEAGLESESDNNAQVLVAVKVTTSNAAAAEQAPRAWRMRISVQKSGDDAKVSNVQFVP